MPIIFRQQAGRTDGVSHGSKRRARFTKAVGGILLLGLLLAPAKLWSVTPPATQSVTLLWDSNPSSDEVAGYRVYFGTESRNYSGSVTVGNATSGTVPGLVNGVAYFFAVTAYDADGLESGFSAEVSFVPVVPVVPRIQTRLTPGGQMILSVQGVAGRFFYVEASEDLTNWTVIDVVLISSVEALELTDPDAANFEKRFYRLRELLL
jgi:Fibronectin type III domain